ncbi:hypothetical protein FPQ18DRAFT_304254 [Pyronema domesticum]|nr:hypothetical protein FPQ18DRAFT_304254 [Pyronema domesticum]
MASGKPYGEKMLSNSTSKARDVSSSEYSMILLHTPTISFDKTLPATPVRRSTFSSKYKPVTEASRIQRWLSHITGREVVLLTGWRMGMLYCPTSVILVFLTNVTVTIYSLIKYPPSQGIDGIGTVIEGSCSYLDKILVSPSREDIDRAHSKGDWLDIGVPSICNMRRGMPWDRLILWWLLALTSIPLHLLYNSAAFSTMVVNDYTVAITSLPVFEDNIPIYAGYTGWFDTDIGWLGYNRTRLWSYTNLSSNSLEFNRTSAAYSNLIQDVRDSWMEPEGNQKWKRLSPQDCVRKYDHSFLTQNKNLVIVTYLDNSTIGLRDAFHVQSDYPMPQGWIGCLNHMTNWYVDRERCEPEDMVRHVLGGGNWTIRGTGRDIDMVPVKECWSEVTEEVCKLQFLMGILAVVVVFNFVKALCMLLILRQRNFAPLVTVGDAIHDFVTNQDLNTAGICYSEKGDFKGRHRWQTEGTLDHTPSIGSPSFVIFPIPFKPTYTRVQSNSSADQGAIPEDIKSPGWNIGTPRPRRWISQQHRWKSAAGLRRWILCLTLISVSIGIVGYLLSQAIINNYSVYGPRGTNLRSYWDQVFGRVDQGSVVSLFGYSMPLFSAALLANAPQAVLSLLYLMYNSIITTMLLGLEWNSYASEHKALRVTNPQGEQKSTYWLHVPFQYGVL